MQDKKSSNIQLSFYLSLLKIVEEWLGRKVGLSDCRGGQGTQIRPVILLHVHASVRILLVVFLSGGAAENSSIICPWSFKNIIPELKKENKSITQREGENKRWQKEDRGGWFRFQFLRSLKAVLVYIFSLLFLNPLFATFCLCCFPAFTLLASCFGFSFIPSILFSQTSLC